LGLLRRVLDLVEASGLRCLVKLLPQAEASVVDPSEYPHLDFASRGSFADFIQEADFLLVDSLGGSPVYESLLSDKPILIYTAIEHQVWDKEFLAQLQKRAICFQDDASYIAGLSAFLADPEAYLQKQGADINNHEIVDHYINPVIPSIFWERTRAAVFQNAGVFSRSFVIRPCD
jgi:hypothetical protein